MADQSSNVVDFRQDDDNTSLKKPLKEYSQQATKRPQLGYLRSAWTTNDLYNVNSDIIEYSPVEDQETIQTDNMYNIRLPVVHLYDRDEEEDEAEEKDEILQEIFRMITVANYVCLTGSIVECLLVFYTIPSWQYLIQHYQDWMPHTILPFYTLWWLFMILVLKNKTEHLRQYLNWTQASAVVMATTNFLIPIRNSIFQQFHVLFVALSILASFMFAFAKRILYANELKSERLKARLNRESTKLQDHVNKHTNEFTQHRLAFLTTVSQEIQDVALMVITTLEQFSPASILSNNHELLSACSLAVPIASISAINTTIRQICHVSSHLQLLSKLTIQAWTGANINLLQLPDLTLAEFDIGELLQNVGDALAGVASKLDVKFVIYHCDNALHHTLVLGDEGAIRHALLNHLRNILECCTPGACIEVGLNVVPTEDPQQYKIIFQITHTASPAIPNAGLIPNANLTAQLLTYIRANCTVEEDNNSTKFEISLELKRGKKDINNKMFLTNDSNLLKNHYANIKFSNEPTLKDLTKFIETLKGLKMVLHAPEQSIFAKHLTSSLANWNTDISHVPVTHHHIDMSTASSSASSVNEASDHSNVTTPNLEQQRTPSTPPVPSPAIEEEHIHSIPPAFILIDDDIPTLEAKLNEFRLQPPVSANVLQAHHHGSRRHHHMKKSSGTNNNFFHHGTTAIIHFTSLTQYKAVRDTIQCYALLPTRDPFSMPRIVVVPKPAGPRRFLTALHTAFHNAVVEPHFSAIATSPSSPLPPVISMLVQKELQQQSPNHESPGRRSTRPLSGISPSQDNYFSQRRRSDQQQQQQQQQQQDYLTAKITPIMNAVNHTSPAAVMAAVAAVQEDVPKTPTPPPLPSVDPTDVTVDVQQVLEKEDKVVTTTPPVNDTTTPLKKTPSTMKHFKLNKKKKKAKGTPFADVASPPINVLIVEDNIINQAILSTWMKKHKIMFSVASNGKEAVDKWKTGGFHLILMDIQLPVMNGIEATKMIRAIEKEQKIGVLPMSSSFLRQQQQQQDDVMMIESSSVDTFVSGTDTEPSSSSIFRSPVIIVALTASSLESDRHAALAAGCNDFLTKPVSLEWLEKKIIEWGCMQALIDFEGWRRWKKRTNGDDLLKKKLPIPPEEEAKKKARIEELTKLMNTKRDGILLPGISNLMMKRKSNIPTTTKAVVEKKKMKPVMKPSKSDSDTLYQQHTTQQQASSQSDITSSSSITVPLKSNTNNKTSRSIFKQKNPDNAK